MFCYTVLRSQVADTNITQWPVTGHLPSVRRDAWFFTGLALVCPVTPGCRRHYSDFHR